VAPGAIQSRGKHRNDFEDILRQFFFVAHLCRLVDHDHCGLELFTNGEDQFRAESP
jgi:hypothetical protein